MELSIDLLQAKVKKTKSPLMLDLSMSLDSIPPVYLESSGSTWGAYDNYCRQLLNGLKSEAVAVKFKLLSYALLTGKGLSLLSELMEYANSLGYYVLLDMSGLSNPLEAEFAAQQIWGGEKLLPCDGVQVSAFYGSDIVRPFLPYCQKEKKDIFIVVRGANKSSSEIQDILAGSRTVHMVAADYANRYGSGTAGKWGYSRVGAAASAVFGDSVKMLRAKYPQMFLLIDGLEYSGANAKNCAFAFDKMGYGAIVSVATSVTEAWKGSESAHPDAVEAALGAIRGIRRKIERYVTIL